MSTLILHHYDMSPFSEKVRLVLGYKQLAWRSVDVPPVMPKPDVVALTGGYRRTPFLQIGADIYCDTALMCRVIDAHTPTPSLYPASAGGRTHILAQWADTSLFWPAVSHALQPAGVPSILGHLSPEAIKAFGPDRAAMTGGRFRVLPNDAAAQLANHLAWLEAELAGGQAFLCGPDASVADFAVAQSIWFIRRAVAMAGVLAPYTALAAWFDRMAAFGHGKPEALSSADAIAIATNSAHHAPVSVLPGLGFEAGADVTIAATDYGSDPVSGSLVGLTHQQATLRRVDERAGVVHVHFPRIGYQLRKADN